jgi:DNA-binding response OmpR family regulator
MSRILVVDDDRELQENIVEILKREGFEVAAAGHGEEALDMIRRSPFDLVLLDMIMPGMGGLETLPQLKRLCPGARVIMITAFATVDNAVSAMRKGADDYLTKPFKVDELLATVRRGLEEAKLRKCRAFLNMDDTFNSLANTLRREVLLLLSRGEKKRFMDIARALEVEDHTKVNFHLKVLREAGLITQDQRKCYLLTREGEKIIECLQAVAENLTP